MKKVNVSEWLSNDELVNVDLLIELTDIEEVGDLLVNQGSVFIYDGYTKEELAKEVAFCYGIADDELHNQYFDYSKFADNLINNDDNCYYEVIEENKYMYLDEKCYADNKRDIVLGKMKGGSATSEFVKLSKHRWSCGSYWSFGHISNNGLSCGIESYLKLPLSEAFDRTWISKEVWDKFRLLMLECYKENEDIEKKLDYAWKYLVEERSKVELILE